MVWRPVVSILMTSPFSDSIVFSVHTRKQRFQKHRFQIAPLWRAFSNGSVFGDRFRRCSVDDSRIRSKTTPFSFENGLVWTGPQTPPQKKQLKPRLKAKYTHTHGPDGFNGTGVKRHYSSPLNFPLSSLVETNHVVRSRAGTICQ